MSEDRERLIYRLLVCAVWLALCFSCYHQGKRSALKTCIAEVQDLRREVDSFKTEMLEPCREYLAERDKR